MNFGGNAFGARPGQSSLSFSGSTGGGTGFGGGFNTGASPGFKPAGQSTGFGAGTGGGTGGIFGSSGASTNPFGGSGATGGAGGGTSFGASNNFGAGATTANAFGASAAGAFGTAAAGGFGTQMAAAGNPFGAGSTTTGFGSTTGTTFGATTGGAFGANASSPFAARQGATTTSSPFGATPGATTTGFGAPAVGGGAVGGFGASPQQSGNMFGTGTTTQNASSGFGASSFTGFGAQQPQQQTGLGMTGAFGTAPTTMGGMGVQGQGTGNPPFSPHPTTETQKNQTTHLKVYNISATASYQNKSQEELRLEDYRRGNKGPGTAGMAGTGMAGGFGMGQQQQQQQQGAPLFGGISTFGAGTKPATTGFGATAPSGFGATAAPNAFGSQGGGFGATTNMGSNAFGSTAFGQQQQKTAFGAPVTGGFGATGNAGGAFGQTKPAGTLGFGTNSGAFGSTGGGFGSPGFGQAQSTAQPAGFAGFGTQTGTNQPTQQATTGFGGGAFGGGAFGSTSAATQPVGFGSTSAGGGFTSGAGFGGGGFGATKPAAGGFGSFGTGTTAPTSGTTGGSAGFGSSTVSAPGGGFGFGAGSSTPAFGSSGATTVPAAGSSFGSFGVGASSTSAGGFGALKPGTTGFASSAFGAPATGGTSSSFGGFGTSFGGGTGFNNLGAGGLGGGTSQGLQQMNPQQQQQQLLQQLAQVLQQQQQQQQSGTIGNISDRLDLLKKKKDELTKEKVSKEDAAAAAKAAEKPPPNLFAGFVGSNAKVAPVYRSSPRSAMRVTPRGVSRGAALASQSAMLNPPPLTIKDQDSVNEQRLLMSNERLLAADPAEVLSRSAKKRLIVPPSSFKSPIPDPLDALPPPPSLQSDLNASNRATHEIKQLTEESDGANISSVDVKENQDSIFQRTPARDLTNTASSNVDSVKDTSDIDRKGDATGLTPGAAHTPYNAALLDTQEKNTPVSFRLSPNSSTTDRRYTFELKVDNSRTIESSIPKLTREGYFSSPDISMLEMMNDVELSHVRNFTIFRPNVGKIEWLEDVDIRGLDLDEIVNIEPKEVFVYEGNVPPPPQGEGLNKPALVTLNNVFPKAGSSKKKKDEFHVKLKDFCIMNDAEMISYNSNTGEWVFEVKHFSRYGLNESDDEEEGVNGDDMDVRMPNDESKGGVEAPALSLTAQRNLLQLQTILKNASRPAQSDNIKYSSKSMYEESMIGSSMTTMTPAHTVPMEGIVDSPPLSRRRLNEPLDAVNESSVPLITYTTEAKRITTIQDIINSAASVGAHDNCRVFDLPQNSPCFQIMLKVKKEAAVSMQISGDRLNNMLERYTTPGIPTQNEVNGGQPRSSVPHLQVRCRNYALSLGRSFRVGWSADGKIAHPGMLLFSNTKTSEYEIGRKHRVAVQKIENLRWSMYRFGVSSDSIYQAYRLPMENILHASSRLSKLEENYPLWVPPRVKQDMENNLDEYSRFLLMLRSIVNIFRNISLSSDRKINPDWILEKALSLLHASVGQEEKTSFSTMELLPLYEDRQEEMETVLWDCRRTNLSLWLKSIVDHEVLGINEADDGHHHHHDVTFQRIYELLTVHRIEDAVALAERSGLNRLALIISQLDGDCSISTLMRNQMEVWRNQGAVDTIPESLLNVYRIAAGMVIVDEGESPNEGTFDNTSTTLSTRSIMLGLGWARALGCIFWYCANSSTLYDNISSVGSALEVYELALQDQLVDPPASPFVNDDDALGADVSLTKTNHALYSLLQFLYSSTTDSGMMMDLTEEEMQLVLDEKARQALSPLGFTRDSLDYRGPYYLLVLLECMELIPLDTSYALIIRQHYITQLLWSGHWPWAIAVALQIHDYSKRSSVVRDIVLRFGGLLNWEEQLNNHNNHTSHSNDELVHLLLARKLFVPEELIHESTAYLCHYNCNYEDEVRYLINAGRYTNTMEVLINEIAPNVMLASPTATQSIWTLLESTVTRQQETGSYADYWTNLSDIFLTFLRLKFQIQQQHIMEVDNIQEEEETLKGLWTEAYALMSRLRAHQAEKDSQQQEAYKIHGTISMVRSAVLQNVVIHDMYTYLYNILMKFEYLRGSFTSSSTLGGITELFLTELGIDKPVRNDVMLNTLNLCTISFQHDAVERQIKCLTASSDMVISQ